MRGVLWGLGWIAGCTPAPQAYQAIPFIDAAVDHPTMMVTDAHKDIVLARIDREPYATILTVLEERANRPLEVPDSGTWDHSAHGHNGEVAQANAFLAWLFDDEAAADRAMAAFGPLADDFESNATWDVNIRMPAPLIGYTHALDLLLGTPWVDDAFATEAADKLTTINTGFFDRFVANDAYRQLTLGNTQNNHPIRTAAAIGTVAIAFPEHPEAATWANWAVSELDYLWGANGMYVQADGGVSEGPFYYGFGLGPTLSFFIDVDNAVAADHEFIRDCRNRQDVDPWVGHGCVDGETFVLDNPLHGTRLPASVDWSIALRLPSGYRPPLADAYFNPLSGGALMTGFGGGGHTVWDWMNTDDDDLPMTHGMDLVAQHLVYVDDTPDVSAPDWTTRFLPDAGNAVFRSGWDSDARWLLLVAENGPARKTVHDHVDGLSFSMAAYGEYLLVDPGYYKPSQLDNAVTAQAPSHNVILIDGQGAPDKGLLTNFGDTDAFLENTHDGDQVDYAEARQSYEQTEIVRGVAMVRDRYFVVADRLTTDATTARTHAWRLGGYAGGTVGGTFSLQTAGARWERDAAGVDLFLASTEADLQFVEPTFTEYAAPHVHEFNRSRDVAHHGVIDGEIDAVAPDFLAILAPYRVGATDLDGPLEVQAIFIEDGSIGWTVTVQSDDGPLIDTIILDGDTLSIHGADDAFTLTADTNGVTVTE